MHDDDIKPSALPASASPLESQTSQRYVVDANGAARDHLLDRTITLQTVDTASADELLHTARFFSRLDHPGLPCTHDFVHRESGASLVMRSMTGRSLAAIITESRKPAAIASPAACALTFIKVCEALAAAHAHGVVHGALKPDSVMLGDSGEAIVTGWESAIQSRQRPSTMRYASQSKAESSQPSMDGLQEDIRGLGLCLYTAAAGEAPARDSAGRLASSTMDLSAILPAALEAVIRKAMASTAADGYHSITEVRDDLERFLTGQTPQAVGSGALGIAAQWISHHRRALTACVLAIGLLVGSIVVVNWKSVKTYAAWGSPLLVEQFDGKDWKSRFSTLGSWDVKDGRLISSGDTSNAFILNQRLNPPVAIEYTGRFEANVRPGDLSVWWCEGNPFGTAANKRAIDQPGWFVQAAANENTWCTIQQVPQRIRLAVTNIVLKPGIDYHFRVEIESDRLAMWIDGTQVLDHRELFPIGSGSLALYTWDPGKSFDDLRIWQREVPELISPLALGDEAYRAGRFSDAARLYGRVAESHVGKSLGIQGLYFQGLAQQRMGDPVAARETWKSMPDAELRHRAECLIIDDLVEHREVGSAVSRFTAMWNERPEVRDVLRDRWQIAGQILRKRQPAPKADLDAWITLRDTCIGDDKPSRWLVAGMLESLQRWEEILKRFPDEHRSVAPAMLSLGRGAEVLKADWTTSYERVQALVGIGELDRALHSPDITLPLRNYLLCKTGKAQDAAAIDPYPATIYLGNIDINLRNNSYGDFADDALLVAGMIEEAAGDGIPASPASGHDGRALVLLGRFDEADKVNYNTDLFRLLAHLTAGRIEQARAMRPTVTGNRDGVYDGLWFAQGAGLALVDVALGDENALRNALTKNATLTGAWGGRMALVCQAALDAAKDEMVLDMPWRTEAQAWLHIAHALRAELAHDQAAAYAAWHAFTSLPGNQRILDENSLNVEVEAFAAWRLSALAAKAH